MPGEAWAVGGNEAGNVARERCSGAAAGLVGGGEGQPSLLDRFIV